MGTARSAQVAPSPEDTLSRAQELHRLRGEISRMQRRRSDAPLLPVPTALEPLLPDGGLRVGSSYSISPSPSLLGALLSASSQRGSWCAVIGMPTLGVEAMADLGVALDRLILVPEPGARWLSIASSLSEVVPLVAVHPRSRVSDAEVSRLNARLRDRASTLLVTASWPQAEATLRIERTEWLGLGSGWGLLSERIVTLSSSGRRLQHPRRVQVRLPDALGSVTAAPVERPRLRAMEQAEKPAQPSKPTGLWAVAG